MYPAAGTDQTLATEAAQVQVAAGNATFIEFVVTSTGAQGFQIQFVSYASSGMFVSLNIYIPDLIICMHVPALLCFNYASCEIARI